LNNLSFADWKEIFIHLFAINVTTQSYCMFPATGLLFICWWHHLGLYSGSLPWILYYAFVLRSAWSECMHTGEVISICLHVLSPKLLHWFQYYGSALKVGLI